MDNDLVASYLTDDNRVKLSTLTVGAENTHYYIAIVMHYLPFADLHHGIWHDDWNLI